MVLTSSNLQHQLSLHPIFRHGLLPPSGEDSKAYRFKETGFHFDEQGLD